MKITTNGRGTYFKEAGKEEDGVMSLAMFDYIAQDLNDGSFKAARTRQIGILTRQHFDDYNENPDYHVLKEMWEDKQSALWYEKNGG